MTDLNELARGIHANAVEHGWWGQPVSDPIGGDPRLTVYPASGSNNGRNFGEVLALIHSEVSEALESWRDGDPIAEMFMVHKDGTRCSWDGPCRSSKGTRDEAKPDGVPSELADIIIRVLDASAAYGIDIEAAVQAKIDYNRTRPFLHGRAR
jgi:hypothetical protein